MTVNGTVTFTGLCPGTYSLYYYKPGWWRPETFSWNVTMGCNDYQEYTKTIQPFSECCNGTISGTVLDSIANAPIANAKIYLHVNNGTSATATSDANGAFQFTSICPGYYNMSISAYGYNYKDTPYFNQGCNDTSNNLTIQMVKK
jgi:protocatechuate 3,4-dioxygenase beta subunit